MPANPRPWTYRKTYIAGGSPFITICDATGQAIGYLTLWPENVEENAKLICEAVNNHPYPLGGLLSAKHWGIAGDPGPEIVSGPVAVATDETDDEPRGAILR